MSSRIFWAIGTLLLATVIHLGYTLYGSRVVMASFAADAAQIAGGTHRIAVLDAASHAAWFEGSRAVSAVALCAFDLAQGDVAVEAEFGQGPWTLTLYSARGGSIYALNDSQAGANRVTVRITHETMLSAILGTGEEAGSINDGWRVETGETSGLAVLWVAVPDPALRPRTEASLRSSTCAPVSRPG